MRVCRVSDGSRDWWGRIDEQDLVSEIAAPGIPAAEPSRARPLGELRLLPPVAGGRIFGIGRNYASHAKELNPDWKQDSPLVFLKPDTALCAPGDPIPLPTGIGRVDYEGELAVVLGSGGRNLDHGAASRAVLGVCCANDISARELQQSDGQWVRAKGFDGFCPLGPWIACGLDPDDLGLRTELNGKIVQEDRTSSMSRSVPELISFLSSFCTLRAGDVILTGTPAGVGPLRDGDVVAVEIEGAGRLENRVKLADRA